MHTREEKLEAFGRLLDVLDELRVKCPWDRKQTNESLRPNTIEEVYELCDALMKDDRKNICKELGDVLLHVVFYAKIGSETGDFDIKDVCDKLCDKLIFRHPHVFGEVKADTAEKVSENWEQIKMKEIAEVNTRLRILLSYRLYDFNDFIISFNARDAALDIVRSPCCKINSLVGHDIVYGAIVFVLLRINRVLFI